MRRYEVHWNGLTFWIDATSIDAAEDRVHDHMLADGLVSEAWRERAQENAEQPETPDAPA